LLVVNDQVRLVKGTGVSEGNCLAIALPAEYNTTEALRAQQRYATNGVVNHLVEIEDVDGIGECLTAGAAGDN
jgi:hypothetical protein